MPEIRRIDPAEAKAVAELWDQLGRSVPDGGPLNKRGRGTIAAMLVLAAGCPRVGCFVAVDAGAVLAFAMAELVDDGLLPARYGELQEHYARDDAALDQAVCEAAIAWLWEHDVWVVRTEVDVEEPREALMSALAFTPEALRYATYRE